MTSIAQDLPHDVLQEIFEHLAIVDRAGWSYHSHTYTLGWIVATHVCGWWRVVGLDMAGLWADAVCAFPSLSVANELVARARDCRLKIEYSEIFDGSYNEGRRRYLPIDWGARHLQRAYMFECYIHQWLTFTRKHPAAYIALTSPLPALKHLTLFCEALHQMYPTPTLKLRAPALVSARLWNIVPLSFSSSASFLRGLTLYLESSCIHLNDLSLVLAGLRGLSCLEYLGLTFFGGRGTVPIKDRSSVVHLERLHTLQAECSETNLASDLFELISAPHIIHTSMKINDWHHPWLIDEHIFAKAVAQQQQTELLNARTFSVSEGHLSLQGDEPGQFELNLNWWSRGSGSQMSYPSVLTSLSRCLDFSHITSCELSCLENERQSDEVDAALAVLRDAFVSVETLTLYNTPHPTTLRMLLAPAGESPTPFPALRALCLGAAHRRNSSSGRDRIVHTEGTSTLWWDTVKDVLLKRRQMNGPVKCLVLKGEWCTQESWTEEWTKQGAECLACGLVSEVVDRRVYLPGCSRCNVRR